MSATESPADIKENPLTVALSFFLSLDLLRFGVNFLLDSHNENDPSFFLWIKSNLSLFFYFYFCIVQLSIFFPFFLLQIHCNFSLFFSFSFCIVQLSIFFPFFLLQIHCNFSQVLSRLLFFLLHSELRFRVVIYVYIDTTREKWVFAKASDLGFRFFMEVPSSEVTFSEYICTCTLSMIIRSYIYHLLTFSAEHKLFQ